MSEYIFIKDLSFSYPESSVPIFENLNLSFYEGWTVISGANGSGKSTLLSLIMGYHGDNHPRWWMHKSIW